eukprot:6189885-Pleurochrysis_carterae.AAC.2
MGRNVCRNYKKGEQNERAREGQSPRVSRREEKTQSVSVAGAYRRKRGGRFGSRRKVAGAGCGNRPGCLLRHVGQGRVAVPRQRSRLGVSCLCASLSLSPGSWGEGLPASHRAKPCGCHGVAATVRLATRHL